ncbi:type VII secretion protein EccCa [Nocardioides sp. AE5]|uniref:type VII secretion protein EccCa n=1 Tax=Nocardioides sp. AE5 TaxID=2962573 RepID=UPI0028816A5A|nr:type VII secretion protein EccCa [Nocardioides sp. AE5]MDT0200499.1 type VII secretion protein EccCa [Nocardioides sp. AE5]
MTALRNTSQHEGTRLEAPRVPVGRISIQAPPELRAHEGAGNAMMMAIPMLASVGAIVMVASLSGADNSRRLIAAGLFVLAMVGFIGVQVDRQRRQRQQQVAGSRTEYLRHLAAVRRLAREAAAQQRAALTWLHPDPDALPSLAEDRTRLWERTATDDAWLHVRIGLSAQPLSLELVPPEAQANTATDPASASALHRLLAVHRTQQGLPASIDLAAVDRIEVTGPGDRARALARALICSATASHSPEQVAVAVLCRDDHLAQWDWLKWLPHALSGREGDAVGARRMVTTSLDDLGAMLPEDLPERPRFGADEGPALPHIILVIDGGRLPPGNHVIPPDGLHGVTLVDLPERWDVLDDPTRLRLDLSTPAPGAPGAPGAPALVDGKCPVTVQRLRHEPMPGLADQVDLATAEAFARRLSPLSTVGVGSGNGAEAAASDFMDLLGLGDVHSFEASRAWRPRPARDRLRVPIGNADNGSPVHLDLKESAQQGMGPHGLVIGATGSGKSEFLRTLVLGLAMTHPPDQLNMVLVDFKGGATFAGMSSMPHVSAVITNLAEELTLVDRMQDALSGEMVRRQELLRSSGNHASVRDYERARATDPEAANLPPIPSLFIVVDEFSELLSAKPEFIDLFVAIGRLGRSLGLHLLLASQRLEEGRLRGLEAHLSYRIGLRTFSAVESRAVLGVPDAYELPAVPGLGYLKPDPTSLVRFKAAYVSGPPTGRQLVRRDAGGNLRGILPFTIAEVQAFEAREEKAEEPSAATPGQGEADSLLDLAVARMAGIGPGAHQVWLPPLDLPATIDALMPDLAVDPHLGLHSPQWRAMGDLTVPVGIIDRPREQRRDTLTVSLSGAAGHVAVVGAPRSGKSTLLRTMVTSLAMTTTPLESQFFVLDFGGGTFTPLADLPHVAGVATRSEPDVVRRIVAEVRGVVDRREAWFRANGIDTIETYRMRRNQGSPGDGYGDVFLVVDGWSTLRSDFDDIEIELQALAQRGLTFGVHLVVATGRWADFRSAIRDTFGTRLELRLGDPLDSEVDRKVAQLVPAGRPGRGLVPSRDHFLAALPRIDGDQDPASLGDGVEDLIRRTAAAWSGPAGPKVRLLPDQITLAEVRERAEPSHELLLGINERELAPVGIDADAEPHLLVLGDGQSGKSSLLRSLVSEIVRVHSPEQAQIIAVDYRRSLLGEIPDDYRLDYLTSATQAMPAFKDLADYLTNRLPGPDVTPEQLRNRSWWTGAEAWVLVDDYDLVATAQGSPVHALVPLLAQARDIGMHLVVTRRMGGASRALYDPVIQALRDLAMPGIMLSGNPEEGALLGNVRPEQLPPGRGRLVTRDAGVQTVQLAWSAPTA